MMFLWLPLLLLCPLAMVLMMRMDGHGMNHSTQGQSHGVTQPDPAGIARQRLARGEITSAEYEEIRRLVG